MKTSQLEHIVDRLLRLMPALVRRFERPEDAVSRGTITLPQLWALHYLSEHGASPVHNLSRAIHLQLSSTSGLVDRLARLGLVRRARSRQDRRVVFVSLTPRGRETLDRVFEERRESMRRMFALLTPKERETYLAIVEKLVTKSGGEEESP